MGLAQIILDSGDGSDSRLLCFCVGLQRYFCNTGLIFRSAPRFIILCKVNVLPYSTYDFMLVLSEATQLD